MRLFLTRLLVTIRQGESGAHLFVCQADLNCSCRMDLYDDEALPRVTAILEIPGVSRDGFTVQVQNNVLIVQGDRGSPMVTRLIRPAITPTANTNSSGGTPVNAGLSLTTPLSSNKFRVRDLKFGRFRREIPLPEGTKVCSSLTLAFSY